MTGTSDVERGWRDYYESKAASFDEHRATYGSHVPLVQMFYGARRDAVSDFVGKISGAVALEIGCGSGEYLRVLEGAGASHVAGFDLSFLYARQARALSGVAGVFQASASTIPVRSASVDIVLATEVLEHLPEPEVLLDEAERILAPGGQLVLTTPNPASMHDLLYRVKRRRRGYDVNEHPGLRLPCRVRRELELRGFTIERTGSCNFLFPYPISEVMGRLPSQERVATYSSRLERRLQRMPIVQGLGWTTLVRARKQTAAP